MASFYNPVKIYFGMGKIKKLLEFSPENKKILLLTGLNFLEKSGYLEELTNQLEGKDFALLNSISPTPDVEDLVKIKEEADSYIYDCILAVGGGSVIDAAKFLVAFHGVSVKNRSDVRESIINANYAKKRDKPLLVAVPTTAGTGSDVTSWATIWDREYNKKYSIESQALYPYAAVVDPLLTVNKPLKLTAISALDALSHAVEAYWSRRTNEIVRMYAIKAIEKIVSDLGSLLADLKNTELRSSIAFASLCAGLAFSNTKTTACHSISYPLTLTYGIEHGIAASMTLAKMLTHNEEALVEKEQLLKAFGVEDSKEVDGLIKSLFVKAGLSYRLRDYGVKKEELELIAERSFTPGRMDNNPVEITKDVLQSMLASIY